MRLTIIGATGGIGRQLLIQAVAAGHEITAVVRNPNRLPETSARVIPTDFTATARNPDRIAETSARAVPTDLTATIRNPDPLPETSARATPTDLTATARNPDRLAEASVRVVVADLADADPACLRSAVEGADAVLSGLGARSAAEAGVASRGTRAIVQAMEATGGRRIVVVSAASVGTVASPGRPNPPRHNPGDGFFMRHLAAPLAKAAFRAHYADLALMEDLLRDSDLDWTVSRPPRLLNRRLRRQYRTAYGQNVRRGMFIARADVARHMLEVIERPETFRRDIGIAY